MPRRAWKKYTGLSKSQAKRRYVALVERISAPTDRSAMPASAVSTPSSVRSAPGTRRPASLRSLPRAESATVAEAKREEPEEAPGTPAPVVEVLSKRGMLTKKRDHMSGWRSRFFVLDGKMLYYYRSKNDHIPRGSTYLTKVSVHKLYTVCGSVPREGLPNQGLARGQEGRSQEAVPVHHQARHHPAGLQGCRRDSSRAARGGF